jgi:hypothetical protein
VKIAQIIAGLKSDQIIGAECLHQPIVPRHRHIHLSRRERYVQEKAEPALDAELAQFLAHGDQMIIVDPDQIVVAEIGSQLFGEQPVDPAISDIGIPIEAREIEPIVKQRPERAIGKAAVVAVEISLAQIDRDEGDVGGSQHLGPGLVEIGNLPAPAEPDAAALAQRSQHPDRQSASDRRLGIRYGSDAVGNNDEAGHDVRRRPFRRHPPSEW